MYGLALEGGGAKGAYHIGAVRALMENDYKINGVVGTSIGAFNAAIIAQGDFDKLYDFWYNASTSDLINIEDSDVNKIVSKKIDISFIKNLGKYIKGIGTNKGIDVSRYRNLIESMVDEDKLRSSDKLYGLVTVSVSDKKNLELYKEDIPKGEIAGYVMASSYIPIFKMERISDKFYIDGGFYDNCPVNMLVKKGYKNIIAIRTGAIGISRRIKNKDKLNILEIRASKDLGGVLMANNELARRNIQMGYYDTIRLLKGLKGTAYYINPLEDGKIFDSLLKLTDEQIYKIAGKTIKDAQSYEPKKLLFEKIIPMIAKRIKATNIKDYNSLFINILESLLVYDGTVDMYRIYDFDELLNILKKRTAAILKKEKAMLIPNSVVEMTIRIIKEI